MSLASREPARLADQIHRAFEGDAWHGDSVLELLRDVTATTAAAHPIPKAHSIWELVLHIAAWDDAVRRRIGGAALTLSDEENFPAVKDTSESAWEDTRLLRFLLHVQRRRAARTLSCRPDSSPEKIQAVEGSRVGYPFGS